MSDLLWTPAVRLRELVRGQQLSPVELLEALLAQIERVDPAVHAFVTLEDGDRLLAAARAAEQAVARGEELGLLHGLPVTIKDLEPTNGLRTTFGSKFYESNVPAFDGAVTGRVRAAGGIVLGKTNTPHWGHRDMCDNLVGPTARNPWRLDRTPGGSSGGAAAAAACGMGPLHHGSDGAGSIRIPSALCGVYGLKPSFGRVPYWPNTDMWAARSHNGPIARTVRDAALLLSAIAGPDPRDPTSLDAPPQDYVALCTGDLTGLRVAWSADFGYAPVDPEVRRVAEAAARRFEELGCAVEAVVPGWEDPAPAARTLWHASMAYRYGHQYRERPDWFEPSLAEMIEDGFRLSAVDVGQAALARSAFYERARAFMERRDLLLTPQMPCVAWSVDGYPTIEGRPARDLFERLPFTFPFNFTGWPAASVPCGVNAEGLPIALQIVAPWRRDDLCLRASAAFEALQPWEARRPAVAD